MAIILAGKYVIPNPEERIREYCEKEIYAGYDDKHDVNDAISSENIEAANRLFAWIIRCTASRIIDSHELQEALAEVKNRPLGEISDADWVDIQNTASQLLEKACNIKGVRLAVATKVLHLKRPKLIPVLDSYIIKLLLDRNIPDNKARLAPLGIEAMNLVREDLIANRVEFLALSQRLADLPIQLGTVRLYDILAWTHEKWDRLGITSTPYGSKPGTPKNS